MGGQWAAIVITLVAATGNNVGKALQKQATRQLPRFSLEPAIMVQYLRSREWLIGLATDLGGALLMIAAFALAPVSLVQPVSGVGLVSLALFSHFYLQETLQPSEWMAVAFAAAGTIGLGATTEEAPSGSAVGTVRAVVVLSAFVLALGVVSVLRLARRRRRRGAPPPARSTAYMYGLQAGACFGLSAASCRTGFLLATRQPLCVPAGLAASVGLTSGGFALQTCGLKDGNSLVVCTAAAVTSMVSGVAVGILALGERLPSTPAARLARLASWALILAGVAGLAAGSGGAQQVLGLGATKLPAWVWQWMPARAAMALRTAARSHAESRLLPVIAVGGITAAGSPLLPRPGHHKVGGLSIGVGGGGRLGSSAEPLESPRFRTLGSSSPRRAPLQLQTAGSAGLSSLSRPSLEPGAVAGSFLQPSPLGPHPGVAIMPPTPHAQ